MALRGTRVASRSHGHAKQANKLCCCPPDRIRCHELWKYDALCAQPDQSASDAGCALRRAAGREPGRTMAGRWPAPIFGHVDRTRVELGVFRKHVHRRAAGDPVPRLGRVARRGCGERLLLHLQQLVHGHDDERRLLHIEHGSTELRMQLPPGSFLLRAGVRRGRVYRSAHGRSAARRQHDGSRVVFGPVRAAIKASGRSRSGSPR